MRQKEESEYDKALARADEKLKKKQNRFDDDIVSNMTEHEATAFHFMPDNFEELIQMRKTPSQTFLIENKLLNHIV